MRGARMPRLERHEPLLADPSARDGYWLGAASSRVELSREPGQHVRAQPADTSTVITALPWKTTQEHEARDYPARPASEARDIVGAQELFPGRGGLVHVGRESDVTGKDRRRSLRRRRQIVRTHKRPSCVIPVV